MTKGHVVADYLGPVFDPLCLRNDIIKPAFDVLNARRDEFDALAVCGTSGLTVGPILAYLLGKPLLVVRKETRHHSSHWVEGVKTLRDKSLRYVIIDDFALTGETVQRIIDHIREFHNRDAQCVAGYFYIAGEQCVENLERAGFAFPCWNDPKVTGPIEKPYEGFNTIMPAHGAKPGWLHQLFPAEG
jgi:hypoxanthine phosphoribosyltransferase